MTTEREPGRAEQEQAAADQQGSDAARPGSKPPSGAGLRALLLAAVVAWLGFAAGSRAASGGDQVALETPSGGAASAEARGCADLLPPGHPPIGSMLGLPPGHPPIRARPRLPAGHPPIPSTLPPLQAPPLPVFTI